MPKVTFIGKNRVVCPQPGEPSQHCPITCLPGCTQTASLHLTTTSATTQNLVRKGHRGKCSGARGQSNKILTRTSDVWAEVTTRTSLLGTFSFLLEMSAKVQKILSNEELMTQTIYISPLRLEIWGNGLKLVWFFFP